MTRAWIPIAAIALAAGLRIGLLDHTPERAEERGATDLSRVGAGRAFATYIGTAFLGSFRTVAVDILWLRYLDAADDRRFFEAVEYGEFITTLQPRNTEVASLLAHDYIMNIPALTRDADEQWRWIRRGALLLRESADRNPTDIYIRHQLAFWALRHRYAPVDGALYVPLVLRYMADEDLRRRLERHPEHRTPAQSPFFTSAEWFTEARDMGLQQVAAGIIPYSAGGLSMRPEHVEAEITESAFMDAFWRWINRDFDGAARRFLEEADRAEHDLRHYQRGYMHMQERRIRFLRDLPEVVEASRRWRERAEQDPASEEARRAYLEYYRATDSTVARHLLLDRKYLGGLLARAGSPPGPDWRPDPYEYNNHFRMATRIEGRIRATFAPLQVDEDWYEMIVPAAPGQPQEGPPVPRHVRIRARAPDRTDMHLSVFAQGLLEPGPRVLCARVAAGEEREERIEALEPGVYWILIEPAGDPRAGGSPEYELAVEVGVGS